MEKQVLVSFLGGKIPGNEITYIHDQLENDEFLVFIMMNLMGIWKGDCKVLP